MNILQLKVFFTQIRYVYLGLPYTQRESWDLLTNHRTLRKTSVQT